MQMAVFFIVLATLTLLSLRGNTPTKKWLTL